MLSYRILKCHDRLRYVPFQGTRKCYRLQSTEATMNSTQDELLKNAKPFHELPGPPEMPIVGSAWKFLPIIGSYDISRQHLANRHKRKLYGNIWRERFGSLRAVVSMQAEDAEVIFNNEGPYPKRGVFTCLKTYRESRKQWYQSTGLLILEGEEWHDLRKKTQKHLMKPKAIEAYMGLMQDVANDFVNRMNDIRDTNLEVPDFLQELYKWSLESVALVALDTRLGCFQNNSDSDGLKMIQAVQTQFDMMGKLEGFVGNIPFWKLFVTTKWRKFEKASDIFSEIAFKYINRAYEELKKSDKGEDQELTLLQALLATKGLDLGGVMVTVADMLFAGIDTTSHTTGFLLYELAKNPDKQELLYQEIRNLTSSTGGRITPSAFSGLRYLKRCLKEALRLHPIIPVAARMLDKDVVLSGYRVPANTTSVVILQEVAFDERYFKNAPQFLPERWQDTEEKPHPFATVPFGFGPRSCIGRRLAELEIICIITEIINRFKVEYHHEEIDVLTKFINTPDKPLRFNFIERT